MLSRPHALPAGFIAPCLPINAPQPPSGAQWLHEIKHDGFRVIARKNGKRVKLYSRPGKQRLLREQQKFDISGSRIHRPIDETLNREPPRTMRVH